MPFYYWYWFKPQHWQSEFVSKNCGVWFKPEWFSSVAVKVVNLGDILAAHHKIPHSTFILIQMWLEPLKYYILQNSFKLKCF